MVDLMLSIEPSMMESRAQVLFALFVLFVFVLFVFVCFHFISLYFTLFRSF